LAVISFAPSGAWAQQGADFPTACEAVKKSREEQKHFTQSRKVAEGAKRTKQLSFASLCALASLREIVCFFTPSRAMGYNLSPVSRADGRFANRPYDSQ
jgi:hypothetical protein